jgi:DNA-binding transcriptional regulator YiaG
MTAKDLSDYLTKHEMSDKEFAVCVGVTVQAVRLWLLGKRAIPKMLIKIINKLNQHDLTVRDL